jgi:hypothetical protein
MWFWVVSMGRKREMGVMVVMGWAGVVMGSGAVTARWWLNGVWVVGFGY